MDGVIGRGTKVFEAAPVQGEWRRLEEPDDVLELMDESAAGVVACVDRRRRNVPGTDLRRADRSGLPVRNAVSHIGIVSREYQVPCIMGATLDAEPADGDRVEVDCSADDGSSLARLAPAMNTRRDQPLDPVPRRRSPGR